jgi:hypothetical protein
MTNTANHNKKPVGLRQQVLLAALECSKGELDTLFTAEDLLLSAWQRDPLAWGLRGHERQHPDSEKIYKELDRVTVAGRNVRGGLVGIGLFEKIRQRTYRLTPKGLAQASAVVGDSDSHAKAERVLSDAIGTILSHPVFRDWQKDQDMPRHFRDAGHFWRIAPGTPHSVIRARIREVDDTLAAALELLERSDTDEISERQGKALFDRNDIERAADFQATLKKRFARDLDTLQVKLT